jgi:hypothetical protein
MSEQISLCGPFYVELAYETDNSFAPEQIQTAYIDGIASEEDAWAACDRIGENAIEAITEEGAPIAIRPDQLLQALIGMTVLEKADAGAA